jgi:probable rRNA maturation factor
MSIVVDVGSDGVRLPMARQEVIRVVRAVLRAEQVREARVSVTFVSNRRIAAINWRHLSHRGSTDVISFGLHAAVDELPVAGDIYIAPDVARRNALAHGIGAREELTRLVVHGVLHVLGFEHPEGPSRGTSVMWRRQEALVQALSRSTGRRARSGRGSRSAA